MPTSDHTQCRSYACTLKRTAAILGIALSTSVGLLWLNQQALERYWQQTHHEPSPFSDITASWWQAGAALEDTLKAPIQQLEQRLGPVQDIAADTPLVDDNEVDGDDSGSDADISEVVSAEPSAQTSPSLSMDDISEQSVPDGVPLDMTMPHDHPAAIAPPSVATVPATQPQTVTPAVPVPPVMQAPNAEHQAAITLTAQDRVLFIGDSMMQGVAPHVMKTLLKQYHVQSTNLSLQSTGLAYPNAFDWPGTLRTTLANTSDIKVLVVFLGPNDPWDMPSRPRGPYLKFKSPAWETEYRSRIRNILDQAKAKDIAVIWVGPPAMKRVALSEGVRFLDGLYQSEVEAAGQRYIAVDDLFGYQDHRYNDPTTLNGHPVRLRSDDGTHFTITGQKLIAHAVLNLLQPAVVEPAATATPEPQASPATPAEVPSSQPRPSRSTAAQQVFADPVQAHSSTDRKAAAAQVFAPTP